jgi:hypothetical protein
MTVHLERVEMIVDGRIFMITAMVAQITVEDLVVAEAGMVGAQPIEAMPEVEVDHRLSPVIKVVVVTIIHQTGTRVLATHP